MKDFLATLPVLLILSCSAPSDNNDQTEASRDQRADSLAHAVVLVDTHVDLPYRLRDAGIMNDTSQLSTVISTSEGNFDFERARQGGLDAPFMSIYIPSSYQKQADMGKSLADSLINMVHRIGEKFPNRFAAAGSPQEIVRNHENGKISLPMGMENGAPIGNDIANVAYFYNRGIRYVTLTHAKDNQICDSSYDTTHTWNGLSPYGRQVVKEMNRVGIMVDISHVSDSTFYQVMRITRAPVIASHSSCRYYTPKFERNMSDDMIRALGRNGGVIQINFGSDFLDSICARKSDELAALLKSRGLKSSDSTGKSVAAEFRRDNPDFFSNVSRVADHIDHVVQLVGIDHVGIGSDFDGVGDSLPVGLKDVSGYPNLIEELLRRGYSAQDIEKICSGNLFRVWNAVIDFANQSSD